MPDSAPPVPFEVGDSVRVKEDVEDSDYPDREIAGWQGRVAKITDGDPPMLLVEWDSITLEEMPEPLIEQAEVDGLSWKEYYVYAHDVEAVEPRDTPQDVKQLRRQLQTRYRWVSLGEEGRYIHQILDQAASDGERALFRAWETELQRRLSFPIEATVDAFHRGGAPKSGDEVQVLDIFFEDALYGLIATVRFGRKIAQIPLADLEPTGKPFESRPLRAYRTWFANR